MAHGSVEARLIKDETATMGQGGGHMAVCKIDEQKSSWL